MLPAGWSFERVTEADLPMLRAWRLRPHVSAWWPPDDLDALYADCVADPERPQDGLAHIARLDGEPVGFIQSYVAMGSTEGWWPDVTDPGVRGIDQFVADGDGVGQGLVRAMFRAFVARLFEDPSVTLVQTDPDPANARAIRCYRAAGFVDVADIVTPDGPALLMHCPRPALRQGLHGG